MEKLVELQQVRKVFSSGRREVVALRGVELSIAPGESLGVIGESGSGKSTLGRIVLALEEPDDGAVHVLGIEAGSSKATIRNSRARVGVVFQEPYESLNPRMSVKNLVAEPVRIHRPAASRTETRQLVNQALDRAGLELDYLDRFPGQLSGGQQQRVGIARAIVLEPELLVLDEPTASLDMTVRARILATLSALKAELNLAVLLISHDISTVASMTDRVVVMYRGQVVEAGPTEEVLESPGHPYTKALMGASLSVDPSVPRGTFRLVGEQPPSDFVHAGCTLAGRCPLERAACSVEAIPLMAIGDGWHSRCILSHEEVASAG